MGFEFQKLSLIMWGQGVRREKFRHKEHIYKNKDSVTLHLDQVLIMIQSVREPKSGVYRPMFPQQGVLLVH